MEPKCLPDAGPGQSVEVVGDIGRHRQDNLSLGHCLLCEGLHTKERMDGEPAGPKAELPLREIGTHCHPLAASARRVQQQ